MAWLASQEHADANGDPVFGPEDIVRMATINPARILRWEGRLGSIEKDRWADLVVVNGKTMDPYLSLIEARETSINLVLIDGVPRVGRSSIMGKFGPATEQITVGGSTRALNLADPAGDPLVGAMTLTQATDALADGMARLPELAVAVDSAVASGAFSGAADGTGDQWRILPDFELDDLAMGNLIAGAGEPYAFWVSKMTLDPITVADDPNHLRTLVAARNLPTFVKKGLPALYGQEVPLPEGATFLVNPPEPVAPQLTDTTAALTDFLQTPGELTLKDRRTIVDQAMLLLQENYVHLPLKRAMHAVDPIQRLRLLDHRLEQQTPTSLDPEVDFHAEVSDIFNSLRDLHTNYRLPAPFNSRVAWLPYLIEEFFDGAPPRRRYIVTRVIAGAGPKDFVRGVEVTHWNGMSMEHAVARNGERQAGSNPDARHARGLNSLTMRPLAGSLPPDEEWVTLRYVPAGRAGHERPAGPGRVHAAVARVPAGPGKPSRPVGAVGGGDGRRARRPHRRHSAGPQAPVRAPGRRSRAPVAEPVRNGRDLPRTVAGRRADRIEDARRPAAEGRAAEWGSRGRHAVRLYPDLYVQHPRRRAVRGRVRPARRGPAVERTHRRRAGQRRRPHLCGRGAAPGPDQSTDRSRAGAVRDDAAEPRDLPQSRGVDEARRARAGAVDRLDERGGPDRLKLLARLRDHTGRAVQPDRPALSRPDRPHHGCPLLQRDRHLLRRLPGSRDRQEGARRRRNNTGAGGANVWTHGLLSVLMQPDNIDPGPSPYKPLPRGTDMRVAARRTTRVGNRQGDILEDLGVKPDVRYLMTRRDILEGNLDLIDAAIAQLIHP